MIQFYAPDIAVNPVLPEAESGHCARVLRMRSGDEAYVVDGKGRRYRVRIVEAHQRHTSVEIIDYVEVPNHWGVEITLAVAPTKNADRMEWLVEKAVEIGVDHIVLLRCEHSERKVMKLQRLENIVVSAMKQSLKGVLPTISEMESVGDFARRCTADQKFVGYCADDVPRVLLADELRPGGSVAIMIGPEGDFSPSEIRCVLDNGFCPVSFGESRLRTETAALFALQAVHIINQINKK